MPIILDPEHNESNALFSLPITWTGMSVLEVGSGDGRLTWRYADKVTRVTALEPDAGKHTAALANRTPRFEHVEFLNLGLDEFYKYVILSDQRPSAPRGRRPETGERRISDTVVETLQSPGGSFTPSRRSDGRVTGGEKFDLVLLSWSL